MAAALFDWDNANTYHIAEHDVTPVEAEQAVLGDPLDTGFYADAEAKERWAFLGQTKLGRILLVVLTLRGKKIRVVSAFEPPKQDKLLYLESPAGRLSEARTAILSDLRIPSFATDGEEAKWWFDNRERLSDELQKAAAEGRIARGGVARLLTERGISPVQPLPTTTIRLDPKDIAKARQQAAARGLRYQTYLKMIIHDALRVTDVK
jgi:uncharacterized DUF497 family protein